VPRYHGTALPRFAQVPCIRAGYGFQSSWGLEPEGEGTRLRLVHSGFRLDDPTDRFAYENMRNGWRSSVMRRLREDLAGEARV
jgi:hypothetical protein